jgi:hypothetical protein
MMAEQPKAKGAQGKIIEHPLFQAADDLAGALRLKRL